MSSIYLYNNRFLPKEEVVISPEDRGYYFGDGLYEVFRVYNGLLFEPELHFARLVKTAKGLRISLPMDIPSLQAKLEELISLNRLIDGSIYAQITRGAAPRNHSFPKETESVLMAYTNEMKRAVATMEAGIRAKTVEDIRWLHCDYKTLNLIPNVLAKQEALDAGADDAILHRDGTVTECSSSNIAIVKDGVIITHPANNLILKGVTRDVVLRLADAAELPVQERPFTLSELLSADEAFLTSTLAEITPIINVDGQSIGNGTAGPVTRRLQRDFEAAIGQ